jgi:glycerol-3-phosphate cytidylyltransferase
MKTGKVGITASCFDLFHAGHVLMLKEAKTVCDYLIVALQTDPTIDRPEKMRPIYERFIQVSACKYVDEIVVYETEKDLLNVLKSLKIDVRILGEEYEEKDFTGRHLDMEFYFNKRRHDYSSTELKKRIANQLSQPTTRSNIITPETVVRREPVTRKDVLNEFGSHMTIADEHC